MRRLVLLIALIALVGRGYVNAQTFMTLETSDGGLYEMGISHGSIISFHGDSIAIATRVGGDSTLSFPLANVNKLFFAETVETPTFSPEEGTFNEPQNIAINCATANATIYYTTDGSEPIDESGVIYGAVYLLPVVINESTTVKAVAVKTGMKNSAVAAATYFMETTGTGMTGEDNTLLLYPNPTGDCFTVDGVTNDCHVFIYSLTGETIMQTRCCGRCSINVSALLPGCYIIRVGNKVRKFVKE